MPKRVAAPWWHALAWWIWPAAVVLVLVLHVWFPLAPSVVTHDTFSRTAEGQLAFYRLANQAGSYVDRNTRPLVRSLSSWDVEPTLCILGPERWPTTSEWTAILEWVSDGGRLVFAFRGIEERTIPELNIRYVPREDLEEPDDSIPPETKLIESQNIAWWTDGRLVAPQAEHVLVEYDDTTQVVSGTHGAGRYLVSATSLVFSNQLLTYGDNPVLAMSLLGQVSNGEAVTFDESLNETGTPKTVGLLFDRELRPLTLQLILLTLLYGWWNCRRFGPLIQSEIVSRQNIVDHADALGTAYWRTGDGSTLLRTCVRRAKADMRRNGRPAEDRGLAEAEQLAQQPRVPRRQAAAWIRRVAK